MENEEYLKKKIKTVYTEIMRRCVDKSFTFPEGGKVSVQLNKFIAKFTEMCGGEFNTLRLVDYCVFQIHKNREAQYQKQLATNVFGITSLKKYLQMSSKQKTYVEDNWLKSVGLTRDYLNSLICKKKHPLMKYLYMPSEEFTKRRSLGTALGFLRCSMSTMMWSPFSESCQQCSQQGNCMKETEKRYPELYRLRMEEYGKRR